MGYKMATTGATLQIKLFYLKTIQSLGKNKKIRYLGYKMVVLDTSLINLLIGTMY